ncbi:MAG: outer membrane lipoprotein-sorting protein, partial [Thermodesulfobacteriota bacterium]|nr:outer membrane lipoprotein-sorting protein [Thermodesulfobacteriota bacterium]
MRYFCHFTACFSRSLVYAICLAALTGGLVSPVLAADDPKARAIMEKVDARDDGDSMISDMKMILIDKNQQTRERTMRS